jgi:hypothetical protein
MVIAFLRPPSWMNLPGHRLIGSYGLRATKLELPPITTNTILLLSPTDWQGHLAGFSVSVDCGRRPLI